MKSVDEEKKNNVKKVLMKPHLWTTESCEPVAIV